MSVYKEAWYAIKEIQNQSKQIWTDACDFGALTKKGDSLWITAKSLVEFYADENSRQEENYSTVKTVSHLLTIADEGTKTWHTFKIEFVKSSALREDDGFFNVEKVKLNKGAL